MSILIKVMLSVFSVVVLLCMWKTAEYFNILPESNKYKGVIAWDLLVLFFVMVYLIMN